jgi:hypothetical protein
MLSLTEVLTLLDPWLISPYRWFSSGTAGYLLGTAILALQSVVLGDLSLVLISRLNRRRLREIQTEMDRHHDLSETALRLGDKESYKAVNRRALEAFGYSFSLGAALFSVSIWPVPFALAWLHLRFAEVPLELPISLPLLGNTLDYLASFLFIYILVRVAYTRVMTLFPWYTALKASASGRVC